MTNLTDEGKYPVPFEWLDNRASDFDSMWHNHFRHIPPFDKMSIAEAERFYDYTWKVYESALMKSEEIEDMLTTAYKDGDKDGTNQNTQYIKEKLNALIQSL